MAITTVAGISSGLLPPINVYKESTQSPSSTTLDFVSAWYVAGYPAAAVAYTGGLTGQALTSSTAAIPFPNPPAGQNSYLGRVNRLANIMLIDRMWENSGLVRTSTATQTFSSAAWPARDLDQSTNGRGVYIGLEVSTQITGGPITAPTITMGYTNSAGVSGRTGVSFTNRGNNAPQGTFFVIPLQAGDVGVRSVQSITFSASWGTAGVLQLVAYRPIMTGLNLGTTGRGVLEDAVSMAMPRLFDNTILQPLIFLAADGGPIEVQITQG